MKFLEDNYKQTQKQGLLVDSKGNRILTGLGDAGRIAYPAFWEIPSVPVDKLYHMTTLDLLDTLKTGGLLKCQGIFQRVLSKIVGFLRVLFLSR